jgi:hypothetical protein
MTKGEPQRKGRIRAVRMLIDKGAQRYDGNRHLDRLLGGQSEVWRGRPSDPATTIATLKRALRSQRQLGRAGHWSYDLNRHFGLLQALKAELARSRGGDASAQPTAAAGENALSSTTPGISETGTETS